MNRLLLLIFIAGCTNYNYISRPSEYSWQPLPRNDWPVLGSGSISYNIANNDVWSDSLLQELHDQLSDNPGYSAHPDTRTDFKLIPSSYVLELNQTDAGCEIDLQSSLLIKDSLLLSSRQLLLFVGSCLEINRIESELAKINIKRIIKMLNASFMQNDFVTQYWTKDDQHLYLVDVRPNHRYARGQNIALFRRRLQDNRLDILLIAKGKVTNIINNQNIVIEILSDQPKILAGDYIGAIQ